MTPLVDKALEEYAARHSNAPSALRAELEAFTYRNLKNPQMVTGALEGALIQMLVLLTGARRVLEIGLFSGYSALAMAEVMPEDGEITSCEMDAQHAAVAREFISRSEHGRKINIILGPALDTLPRLKGPYDLAFIDADKESYCAYYDLILPMLRPGGLLVADNVLWSGRVLDPQKPSDHSLVAFNQKVQQDERVDNVLLTVRDGVMVARKR